MGPEPGGVRTSDLGPGRDPLPPMARESAVAREAAREAGQALRERFGSRSITAHKGLNDVQLEADLAAQRIIVRHLLEAFPHHGVVAEEEPYTHWSDQRFVWAVDPLDGTNNFGYGIAHCAIAISLFDRDRVRLAVVLDPLSEREYVATAHSPLPSVPTREVAMEEAVISLVTNYSDTGYEWFRRADALAAKGCRRAVNLWAPALDLALVASGAIDAMVCHAGYLLDVCGGLFLVQSAGGCVLDRDGYPFTARRSMHDEPLSFVAARSSALAHRLLEAGFLAE